MSKELHDKWVAVKEVFTQQHELLMQQSPRMQKSLANVDTAAFGVQSRGLARHLRRGKEIEEFQKGLEEKWTGLDNKGKDAMYQQALQVKEELKQQLAKTH